MSAIVGVRKIPSVQRLQEIWQQDTEETDEQYGAFLEWLEQGTNRGAVPSAWMRAADVFDWAGRAQAFERADAITRQEQNPNATPEYEIRDYLTRMLQIETRKLLEVSGKTKTPVVGLRDLLAAVKQIQELHDAESQLKQDKVDLSKATDAEISTVLEAQAIVARLRGET